MAEQTQPERSCTSMSDHGSTRRGARRSSPLGSKMPSPHTGSTSKSLSSKPGMETQLVMSEGPEEDEDNPFTVPPDIDVFSIRDKEIKKAKAERERMKTMKIHEKITYSTKIKAKPKELRKALQKEEEEEGRKQTTNEEKLKSIRASLSSKAIKRDYPLVKETFCDYINNEREIFLLKYDMTVKQDEIQSLENKIKEEERKLEMAENDLEKEATMFDEFLKEEHKNTEQALKIAKRQTTAKTKKLTEIGAITSQIEKLQSDITGFMNTLQEHKTYRDFLYQLSPKEWQEKHRKKSTNEKALKTASKANEESASPPTSAEQGQGLRARRNITSSYSTTDVDVPGSLPSSKSLEFSSSDEIKSHFQNILKPKSAEKISSLEDAENETSSNEDEEPELYFTDPQQLLSIFMEMKQENLSFIQDSQEIEGSLAKVQHTFITTREKTEEQLAELKQQVATLKSCITKEEERLADLKQKVQLFSSEEHKATDEDKMLTSLKEKVLEVYRHCTGENEANLQTMQMLTVIEKKVNDLLDTLEKIPPAKIEHVEKLKRRERKTKLREEKFRQQQQQQEERVQRALERSQATREKKITRRLMFRSYLPVRKQKKKQSQEQIDKEKEEYLYYFT